MKLISSAFAHEGLIPITYTCQGININPPLSWQDLPAGTKSLLLSIEDLNVTPNPWVHWLLYNISPETVAIPAGATPIFAQEGICNGGTQGYEGPCQKFFRGTHHYQFTLCALSRILPSSTKVDLATIRPMIAGQILDHAILTGIAIGDGSAAHDDEIDLINYF